VASSQTTIMNRLQGVFGIGLKTGKTMGLSQADIVPAEKSTSSGDKPKPLNLPSEVKKFWDWWLTQCHDTNESLKNRVERIKDLKYMRINDGVVSQAADLYADESVNADSQQTVLSVRAKSREVEKDIYQLFDLWGYEPSRIRAVMDEIYYFGEAFEINSTEPGVGITEVIHIDPRAIKDRIEFKMTKAQAEYNKLNGFNFSMANVQTRLQNLQKVLGELSQSYSKYFRTFLFGFQLQSDDSFLPPWNVTHYRIYTNDDDISPWGKSVFYNTISLFRQYKAAKNLMALGRAMSLPRMKFTVTTSDKMTQAEKWLAVEEARNEYQNISQSMQTKDDFSLGAEIWLASDSLEMELLETNINADNIKDIELLRDEEIISTGIPKGYLIVDKASFGTSSQGLLQQSKIFGRKVFSGQSVFLRELANKIKLHYLISGKFDKEFTEFELSMNFPVVEEARDRMSAKSDSLRLASDVLQSIQTALGIVDPLPVDIVKSIFSKLSFLSPEEIDAWLDGAYKDLLQANRSVNKDEDEKHIEKRISESRKKFEERREIIEDALRDAYLSSKENLNLREGVMNKKHYFIPTDENLDFAQMAEFYRYTIGEKKLSPEKPLLENEGERVEVVTKTEEKKRTKEKIRK